MNTVNSNKPNGGKNTIKNPLVKAGASIFMGSALLSGCSSEEPPVQPAVEYEINDNQNAGVVDMTGGNQYDSEDNVYYISNDNNDQYDQSQDNNVITINNNSIGSNLYTADGRRLILPELGPNFSTSELVGNGWHRGGDIIMNESRFDPESGESFVSMSTGVINGESVHVQIATYIIDGVLYVIESETVAFHEVNGQRRQVDQIPPAPN